MAIARKIDLFIDVQRSQFKNRLVIGWNNPDRSVGGYLDITDLFFSIRDYWESTTREQEKKKSDEDNCSCHDIRFEDCTCFPSENGCVCEGCGGSKFCKK